jgi:hypothetical protein
MTSTQPSRQLDTRPAPVSVQAAVSGAALALIAVAIPTYFSDKADGQLAEGTTLLLVSAIVAFSLAASCFVPLWPEEAQRRADKRRRAERARQVRAGIAARRHVELEPAAVQLRLVRTDREPDAFEFADEPAGRVVHAR